MIDHVSIPVSDLARATAFYEIVLAELGHEQLVTRERTIGFGKRYPEFWLNLRENAAADAADSGFHVALRARDTATVTAFHETALAHGATCDGPPGPREATNPGYFAAFIRDPDGNRIEAVTFVEEMD
jgi:catechol 2,3-dioxygenase-like lactoylglutathione lyase family enzyme